MLEGKRRNPGDVWLTDVPPFLDKLVERCLDVRRVPERNGVQCQAQSAELLFLLLAVGRPDFAAVAVADAARQPVTELLAVELGEDTAALLLAVDVAEQVQCLDDAMLAAGQIARQAETAAEREQLKNDAIEAHRPAQEPSVQEQESQAPAPHAQASEQIQTPAAPQQVEPPTQAPTVAMGMEL